MYRKTVAAIKVYEDFTAAISFIQPLFRTVEDVIALSRHGSATLIRAYRLEMLPFKDAEPVNEVNHEVTTSVYSEYCV